MRRGRSLTRASGRFLLQEKEHDSLTLGSRFASRAEFDGNSETAETTTVM